MRESDLVREVRRKGKRSAPGLRGATPSFGRGKQVRAGLR